MDGVIESNYEDEVNEINEVNEVNEDNNENEDNISDIACEINDEPIVDTNIVFDIEGASLKSDTPVYQLRLPYSQETFFAFFNGDILPVGSMVMIPTRYGMDMAELTGRVHNVSSIRLSRVSHIERLATQEDLQKK